MGVDPCLIQINVHCGRFVTIMPLFTVSTTLCSHTTAQRTDPPAKICVQQSVSQLDVQRKVEYNFDVIGEASPQDV